MTIPPLTDFEGLLTIYSESELRQAIAIAQAIKQIGAGGGGGASDVNVTNTFATQATVAAINSNIDGLEAAIGTPSDTAATSPTATNSLIPLVKYLGQVLGFIQAIQLGVSNEAYPTTDTQINTLLGGLRRIVNRLTALLPQSNNKLSTESTIVNSSAIPISGTVAISNVFSTESTLSAINNKIPASTAIADSLASNSTMSYIGSLGLLYNNGSNLIRWRTTAATSGEGFGRAKVTGATEAFNLYNNVSTVSIGPTINWGNAYSKIGVQMSINSGTISSIQWKIEGSFNGSIWFDLESSISIVNGSAIHSTDKLFQYVRVNVLSISGSSPIIQFIGGAC